MVLTVKSSDRSLENIKIGPYLPVHACQKKKGGGGGGAWVANCRHWASGHLLAILLCKLAD